jgi:hypothetical protein
MDEKVKIKRKLKKLNISEKKIEIKINHVSSSDWCRLGLEKPSKNEIHKGMPGWDPQDPLIPNLV